MEIVWYTLFLINKTIALMHVTIVWNFNKQSWYAFSKWISMKQINIMKDLTRIYILMIYISTNKQNSFRCLLNMDCLWIFVLLKKDFKHFCTSDWESLIFLKYYEDDYIDDSKILKKNFDDQFFISILILIKFNLKINIIYFPSNKTSHIYRRLL